jgi:SOS response regulatory protein OraA/RecX
MADPQKTPPQLTDARVRELALTRLSRSELSEQALDRYLVRKGATEEQSAREVARMVEIGMVSDERVARALIRSQLLRGKAGVVVRQHLRLKGIRLSEERWGTFYQEALSEVTDLNTALGFEREQLDPAQLRAAERERALRLLERKYSRHAADPRVARRAFAALLRRGFSMDVVRSLIVLPRF